jgi:hypothetical protein
MYEHVHNKSTVTHSSVSKHVRNFGHILQCCLYQSKVQMSVVQECSDQNARPMLKMNKDRIELGR